MNETSDGGLRLETLTGDALRRHLPDLARLRATVFRDWPYLYAAEPGYEGAYGGPYADSAAAALVLAFDGAQVVGAATCLPLADETEAVQAPFRAHALDVTRYVYFGESVLLPGHRGRGVGVRFFERREAHARTLPGAEYACFCAVERPDDHPLRPPGSGTLHAFWARRGYVRQPDLACTLRWRDVDQPAQTDKRMVFWLKTLRDEAG